MEIFSATGSYVGVIEKPVERLLLMKKGAAPWTLDELAEKLPERIKDEEC